MIGHVRDVEVLLGACMLTVAQASIIVHQHGSFGRGSTEFGDRCVPVVDDLVEVVPIGCDSVVADVAAEFLHGRGRNVAHKIVLVSEIPGVKVRSWGSGWG